MTTTGKVFSLLLASAVTLAATAGTINWDTPTTVSAPEDVISSGATVFAYTGGTAATVNGVPFTSTLRGGLNNALVGMSALNRYTASEYSAGDGAFAALDAGYKNILVGGVYAGEITVTVTLKSLVAGYDYTVQLWVGDPRSGSTTTRYAIIDGAAELKLPYNDTQAAGGLGSWIAGTFTADSTTQSFTIKGFNSTQINAIQLRVEMDDPVELYWDNNADTAGFGVAGGTWGTDANWSSDATGGSLPAQPVSTSGNNMLHLGTHTQGLASGTLAVSGTQNFNSLFFGLASGDITLSGGTLALSPAANTIRLNSRTNVISSVLSNNSALTVRALAPLFCDGFPTAVEQTIFRNARLADYTGVEAAMGGGFISESPASASVHFLQHTGDQMTFQAQSFNGGYTKCVKLQLTQIGTDISAQVLYSRYYKDENNDVTGYDFDDNSAPVTGNTIATWHTAGGYGITNIKLLPYDTHQQEYIFQEFLTTDFQVVATDVNLADVVAVVGYPAGGSIDNDAQEGQTFYFVNNGTRATCQIQMVDGAYTKCVPLELMQDGADIKARAVGARYVGGKNLGVNFALEGNNSSVVTKIDDSGYGIRSLRLRTSRATLQLTAESPYNGALSIEGVRVIDAGRLGGITAAGSIENNGELVLAQSAPQTRSGTISGSGSLRVLGAGLAAPVIAWSKRLTSEPVVIATNRTLADYGSAWGRFGDGSMDSAPRAADPYHFTNDGTSATVQLQVFNGGHTKVAKVEFRQVGNDITAKIVYTKHCSPDGNNVGADYDHTGTAYAGYNIDQVLLLPPNILRTTLRGVNTYTGGTYLEGGLLEAFGLRALPQYGGVMVKGGCLVLNAVNLGDIDLVVGGMTSPVTVTENGVLLVLSEHNLGHSRPITLDNSLLDLQAYKPDDSSNYGNRLTLKDNARVQGNALRVGYREDAVFTVQGTAPSYFDAGLYMVSRNLYLDVADVTDDETVDFYVSGDMRDMGGYGPMTMVKRQAGTVSIAGSNSAFTGSVRIEAGTLRLDATTALTTDNALELAGGTLTWSASGLNLGTLKLLQDSQLQVGTTAIAFADSSAVEWAEGATLDIAGTFVPRSIRFGTSINGLTRAQLDRITIDGEQQYLTLNDDGYLVLQQGTLIQLR